MNFTRKWVAGLAFIAASSLFAIETATVGYTTKTLAADEWAIIGTQFQDIETQTDIKLTDLVTGTFVGLPIDRTFYTKAPQIQLPSSTGYSTYYFSTDGWVNNTGKKTEITIPAGSAFWFKSLEKCDITTSGGVITTPSTTVKTSNGFNLIANPYPVELALNSDKISWGSLVGLPKDRFFYTNAPQIQLPSSTGYVTYYFSTEGWVDNTGTKTEITIPAGSGFWFNPKTSDITITFAE